MKSKLIIIFYISIIIFSCNNIFACGGGPGPGPYVPPTPVTDKHPDVDQYLVSFLEPYLPTMENPGDNDPPGGDPVRLMNGKFAYSATDLVIKGRKLDVVIHRSYQNGDTLSGFVGFYDGHSYVPGGGSIAQYDWQFPQQAYDIHGATTNCSICKFTVPGTYTCSYRVKSTAGVWSAFCYFNVTVSADTKTSRFGYNWDMNYNLKAIEVNETAITFSDGQNHRVGYSKVDGSTPPKYIGPAHISDYFLKENGLFTLYQKGGMKYRFDSEGCLSKIEDLSGNAISFSYTGSGLYKKLTTITDDLNRKITLNYNSDELLSTITDSNNRIWTYTYDSATNNFLSITTPKTNDYPNGLKKEYTYDSRHNIKTIKDANGQVWLANTYDSLDRVITQTVGDANYIFSYDSGNGKTVVTDRKENINTVYYDSLGNTIKSIDSNSAGLNDPCSLTTSYNYDTNTEKISKMLLPKGNWINYQYDSSGNVVRMISEPNDGEANIITSYTYQPQFDFVATVTDAKNNVTTFNYNESNGNLESITLPQVLTPTGNQYPVISFTYNSFGQVETATAPDGIVTKYLYYTTADNNDPNCGRLWKIIVDSDETQGLKITTEYKYDIYGNVINVKDPNGNVTELAYNKLNLLTQMKSPAGNVTKFSYNVNKMLAQIDKIRVGDSNQTIKYAYNKMDKRRAVTDPLSNVTLYGYDKSENLSDVNDAENNITRYEYDKSNMVSKAIDANGNITVYSYTPNGQLAKITDANGSETTYHYDGFDRLKWVQYPYDTNGVYSYDKNSNVISFKNRDGQTINYTYDALNRIITKTRPNETTVTYTYDIAGRLCDVSQGPTTLASYTYDRVGRLEQQVDQDNRTVKYEYDGRGLRTKLTYPDDTNVTYEYDAMSRLTKVKCQDSTVAEYQYDQLGRRSLLTYGNDANIIYQYDLDDRLLDINNNTSSNCIDNISGLVNRWKLDDNRDTNDVNDSQATQVAGAYASLRIPSAGWRDNNSLIVTAREIGAIGNDTTVTIVQTAQDYGTSVYGDNITIDIGGLWTSTAEDSRYGLTHNDAAMLLVSVVNAGDGSGYMKPMAQTHLAGGMDAMLSSRGYFYGTNTNTSAHHDPNGKIGSALSFNGTSDYINTNNTFENIFNNSFTIGVWCKPDSANPAGSQTIFQAVDGLTNNWVYITLETNGKIYVGMMGINCGENGVWLSSNPLPDNNWRLVTYTVDKVSPSTIRAKLYIDGLLAGDSNVVSFALGALTLDRNATIGVAYDTVEAVNYLFYKGSLDDFRIYNRALSDNEVKTLYYAAGGIQNAYTYDKVDNRKNMMVNGAESKYTYDELYQLTGVDYPDGFGTDANYYYDKVGNRTSTVDSSTTNYLHNKLNQYTAVGATPYSYDSKGNLTRYGLFRYFYDCENRLTDVNSMTTKRMHCEYDFIGRRISRTIYSTKTKYVYDGYNLIAEYDNSGNLLRKYVYGPGIDKPICIIEISGQSEAKYYYHFDGLGSVAALTDCNGVKVRQYSYDVFGIPTITNFSSKTIGNRFMFTGREYDSETGLYYYRARFYKPSIGRFLQTDPIGYANSMNLYQYCLNNPVNFIDPSGLAPEVWHKKFSRGGRVDYGKYDQKNNPQNPANTMNHFRNLGDVEKDIRNDRTTGNRETFEDHIHQGQDSITQGSGLLGVVGHIVGSSLGVVVPQMDPDYPYTNNKDGVLKPSYEKAEEWTHNQEDQWDEANSSEKIKPPEKN